MGFKRSFGGVPSKRQERYTHGWKKLCVRNDQEGMDFKDVKMFDPAMLAKQSWRILENQNSLLYKI